MNILEVCVDSVESAVAAENGGASRIELCSDLIVGGTTPGINLFRAVRTAVSIPIHVLIRPRFGDFCYSDAEFEIMLADVKMFRENGADAVVIGILKPDGSLDTDRMKQLIDEAGDMRVTLHRAFDVCRDPFAVMEETAELGIHTILTSGQEGSAIAGKDMLKKLIERKPDGLEIMIGGGVNADVIRELRLFTGAEIFHMSGKTQLESIMTYRNPNVNMGLKEISEFVTYRTDEKKVRAAVEALKEN